MINKRLRPTGLLMIAAACVFSLSCEQPPGPTVEGVLVTVNGTAITQQDVTFAARGAPQGHRAQAPAADKKAVLEHVILQELAYQRATQLGLDADPAYQAELRAMQVQLDAFKRRKLSELLLQRDLLQKARVSEAEARQYFDANASRLRTEIKVSQILRRDENAIQQIQAELAQGLSFEQVAAKQFAGLDVSKRKPWELGYLQWHQVPEVWRQVINGLQIGETSDIIRGPNSRFWIIKLIDRRENPALGFEQLRPKIIELLTSEKVQQLREQTVRELRDSARIVYSQ